MLVCVGEHPWKTILWLLPVGIVVMILIDTAMGASAEYFNAAHLLEAWGEVLTGGAIADSPMFLMGQEHLGDPLALLCGTTVLIMEPAVVVTILVLPSSWLARRRLRISS